MVNSDADLERFSTRKENNSPSSYKSCVEGDSSSSTDWRAWVSRQSQVTNTAHRVPYDLTATAQLKSTYNEKATLMHFFKSTISGSPSTFKLYPEIDFNPLSSTS